MEECSSRASGSAAGSQQQNQPLLSPFCAAQRDHSFTQQLPEMPEPQQQLRVRVPAQHSPPPPPRAVEMSTRRTHHHTHLSSYIDPQTGQVCWDELDTSSDEAEDMVIGDSDAGGGASTLWSAAAGAFEPFAVEEQSTEVKYLRDMYGKKERECEHLRQIIKELSQSRARVQKTKVEIEEQYVALQKEYYRVNKVSELARTVSQQAVARSSTLKGELAAAQDQARRSRRRAAAAEAKAAALAEENNKLKQQMALLEQVRLSHDEFRTSACAREYLFSHSVSLY